LKFVLSKIYLADNMIKVHRQYTSTNATWSLLARLVIDLANTTLLTTWNWEKLTVYLWASHFGLEFGPKCFSKFSPNANSY